MSLFDGEPEGPKGTPRTAPLAERMRPHSLEDYSGQEHLLGPGKPLRVQIERDGLEASGSASMIRPWRGSVAQLPHTARRQRLSSTTIPGDFSLARSTWRTSIVRTNSFLKATHERTAPNTEARIF